MLWCVYLFIALGCTIFFTACEFANDPGPWIGWVFLLLPIGLFLHGFLCWRRLLNRHIREPVNTRVRMELSGSRCIGFPYPLLFGYQNRRFLFQWLWGDRWSIPVDQLEVVEVVTVDNSIERISCYHPPTKQWIDWRQSDLVSIGALPDVLARGQPGTLRQSMTRDEYFVSDNTQ